AESGQQTNPVFPAHIENGRVSKVQQIISVVVWSWQVTTIFRQIPAVVAGRAESTNSRRADPQRSPIRNADSELSSRRI
ncbi:MAG: hypothetical protein ACI92S_004451, partial [Planctomycetaceae bacterium]